METTDDFEGIPEARPLASRTRTRRPGSSEWRIALGALVFEHGDRVARLSFAMARQLHLPVLQAREVAAAACLHDLGKILVPLEILEHRGALTDSMRAAIHDHPTLGADLITIASRPDCDDPAVMRNVALFHHEHFDGSGYPCGLAGTQIPLEARIVAVADAYDALVSTRSYKLAWTQAEAVAEIQRCVGTHFDPAVVGAFCAVLRSIHAQFWLKRAPAAWRARCERLFDRGLQFVLLGQLAARCANASSATNTSLDPLTRSES